MEDTAREHRKRGREKVKRGKSRKQQELGNPENSITQGNLREQSTGKAQRIRKDQKSPWHRSIRRNHSSSGFAVFGRICGVLCIILGLGLFLYPDISTWILNRQTAAEIGEFDENIDGGEATTENKDGSNDQSTGSNDQNNDVNSTGSSDSDTGVRETDETEQISESADGGTELEAGEGSQGTDAESVDAADGQEMDSSVWTESLYAGIQSYNQALYENGQADFRDAWSVTQSPAILAEWQNEMFGYIEIPAMDVTLPLYIGATNTHMAKGAAILGATSLPIGGLNTNSVIAGHRGFRGAPYFRKIEKLEVGDPVYVTNPWQRLCYRVESIDIIAPTDSDKVKIQEGKDMITLMTCHPYRSHGKYRYVVYCVRDESAESEESKMTDKRTNYEVPENILEFLQNGDFDDFDDIEAEDGSMYASSEPDIFREGCLRRGCAMLIILMIGGSLIRNLFGRKHRG